MASASGDILLQGIKQQEVGTIHFETIFERVMIVIQRLKYFRAQISEATALGITLFYTLTIQLTNQLANRLEK
jgi:hypothetical protein